MLFLLNSAFQLFLRSGCICNLVVSCSKIKKNFVPQGEWWERCTGLPPGFGLKDEWGAGGAEEHQSWCSLYGSLFVCSFIYLGWELSIFKYFLIFTCWKKTFSMAQGWKWMFKKKTFLPKQSLCFLPVCLHRDRTCHGRCDDWLSWTCLPVWSCSLHWTLR